MIIPRMAPHPSGLPRGEPTSPASPHRLPVRVYYEDTDFTGVVYHASYLRYFERGRTEFLRAAGVEHAALLALPEPCAFAVTRISVAFRKPARVDDALE